MSMVGNTPRNQDKNPRSLGSVKSYPPYWNRVEQPNYKGRCVALMRSLMARKVANDVDQPDADQYRGTVVRRTWRPTQPAD